MSHTIQSLPFRLVDPMQTVARILILAAGIFYALPGADIITIWGDQSQGQGSLPPQDSDVAGLTCGSSHVLAITTDGSVLAWGANDSGQTDVPILRRRAFTASAGRDFSMALLDDGSVQAWGARDQGQAVIPNGLSHVIALAAGGQHALALLSDGTVQAWGSNALGESNPPSGLTGIIAIAAGDHHALALRDNGTVVAWGDNTYGQCTIPSGLSGVIAVAAGDRHSLALRVDGTLIAWGDNSSGQTTVPSGLAMVKSISAGTQLTAVVRADGTVMAWGDNTAGALSAATATGVITIAVGNSMIVTMTADQRTIASYGFSGATGPSVPSQSSILGVECSNGGLAGAALTSQGTDLVFGTWNYYSLPSTLSNLKKLSVGYQYIAGLGADGTIAVTHQGWFTTIDPPTDIVGRVRACDADCADGFLAAVLDDGTVRAWGTDFAQQIDVPVGLSGVKALSTGYWGSVALLSNGTVVPWGYAGYNLMAVPSALTGVKQVEDGSIYRMALKDDGTVVVWGDNQWGNVSGIPVGLDGVTAICAGYYLCYALKSDGTIVSWGGQNGGGTLAPIIMGAPATPTSISPAEPHRNRTNALQTSPNVGQTLASTQPTVSSVITLSGGRNSLAAVKGGTCIPRLTISPRNLATNQDPIVFTLAFSQPVSGLTATEINVVGGIAGAISQINSSTYHFHVTPTSSAVTITVPDGAAHNRSGTLSTGASATVTSDRTPPVITISPSGGDLGSLPANIVLSASEPITVADAERLTAIGGTISAITLVSSTSIHLTFVPTAASSTLTCGNGLVNDLAGNPNSAVSALYTVQNPTVTLNGPHDKIAGTPFTLQITFSAPVSGFINGDVLATHASLGPVMGSGSSYTVQVTPLDASSIIINIPLGAAIDAGSRPSLPNSLTVGEHANPSSHRLCGGGLIGALLAGLGLIGMRRRRLAERGLFGSSCGSCRPRQ